MILGFKELVCIVLKMTSKIDLDSKIPTGPWTLYFHSPEETKWTLNTFISLGSMTTWREFWSIIDTLKSESLIDGMFFMMRDPSPPLWESHYNIRGGYYSIRIQRKDASDVYLEYIIAAMLGCLAKKEDNQINGITISPKRGFNIIKIWNTNCQMFNSPDNLISNIREGEVIYTQFVQKKM